MRLHAYAIYYALFLEVLCHLIDSSKLAVHVLVIVVVIELAALGSILPCIGESVLNEGIVTIDLHPGRKSLSLLTGAWFAGLSILHPCLIDHIAGIEFDVGILLGEHGKVVPDIVLHADIHLFGRYPLPLVVIAFLEEPCGGLGVPYESVDTHGDTVLAAVIEQGLCLVEIHLRILIISGILEHGDAGALVKHIIGLHLIAYGHAVIEMLLCQRHSILRYHIGGCESCSHLEITAEHLTKRRDVFLDLLLFLFFGSHCGLFCLLFLGCSGLL